MTSIPVSHNTFVMTNIPMSHNTFVMRNIPGGVTHHVVMTKNPVSHITFTVVTHYVCNEEHTGVTQTLVMTGIQLSHSTFVMTNIAVSHITFVMTSIPVSHNMFVMTDIPLVVFLCFCLARFFNYRHFFYILVILFNLCVNLTSFSSYFFCTFSFQELETTLLQSTLNEYASRPHSSDPDGAVNVGVRVVFTDVQPIRESIDVIVHIQSVWEDARLQYNVTSGTPARINETLIYALHEKIWKPDLYLEPEWTVNNDVGKMNIRIIANGHVGKNKRFRATIPCTTSFVGIEHTDFICKTRVMSYSYFDNEVKLYWVADEPLRLKYGAIDAASEITGGENDTCHWDTFDGMRTSCIGVKLFISKRFPSIFYRLYLPSFMAVLMAWSSFWIHRDEASARIKLGTLVVWTVMTEYISLEVAFPNYLDNIAGNVWMLGCMFFTWASFILYVIIHVVRRREKA
ncbi:glycine receptor subunit alpha-4-like [Mercenaria mercenaria]|uniref:glycine receptor subunit alpha-4-like n=1 Tax=Mercenaria mercenaria TaxID=6596 RepID=UPI00234F48C0|nr:glycine receptor subunit alpha-4-like [Mercenaria mercenaria]